MRHLWAAVISVGLVFAGTSPASAWIVKPGYNILVPGDCANGDWKSSGINTPVVPDLGLTDWNDPSGFIIRYEYTNIMPYFDNTLTPFVSVVAYLVPALDQYCSDPAVPCRIFTYSGGDNIVRLALSIHNGRWPGLKIVYTSAGAGGGSELAGYYKANPDTMVWTPNLGNINLYGSLAGYMSDNASHNVCTFNNSLDVDTARSFYGMGYWAQDNTDGKPIYHLAGVDSDLPNPSALSSEQPGQSLQNTILPGADDGAVAFHSALGRYYVAPFDVQVSNGSERHNPSTPRSDILQPHTGRAAVDNYYGHYGVWPTFEGIQIFADPDRATNGTRLTFHWSLKSAVLFLDPLCTGDTLFVSCQQFGTCRRLDDCLNRNEESSFIDRFFIDVWSGFFNGFINK